MVEVLWLCPPHGCGGWCIKLWFIAGTSILWPIQSTFITKDKITEQSHSVSLLKQNENPRLSPKQLYVAFLELCIYCISHTVTVISWSSDTGMNVLRWRSYSSTCLFIWLHGTEKINIYRVMRQVRRFQHESPCN